LSAEEPAALRTGAVHPPRGAEFLRLLEECYPDRRWEVGPDGQEWDGLSAAPRVEEAFVFGCCLEEGDDAPGVVVMSTWHADVRISDGFGAGDALVDSAVYK